MNPTVAHMSDEDDPENEGYHLSLAAASICEKTHMKLSHLITKTTLKRSTRQKKGVTLHK